MLTHFTQLRFNEKKRNCQSYVQKRQALGSIINLALLVSKFLACVHSPFELKVRQMKAIVAYIESTLLVYIKNKIYVTENCVHRIKHTKFGKMNENE